MRNKTQSDLDRILGRCDIGDCWEWGGYCDRNGYGRTHSGSKGTGDMRGGVQVHRFVYESLVGNVPPGLHLDHLCRNKRCVNPDHLEPVTPAENIRRGVAGRHNKIKTHCPKGHDFATQGYVSTGSNGRPRRNCKTCHALLVARRNQSRKGENSNG